MKYNLANEKELKEAREYLTKLLSQKAVVEIIHKHPGRSLNQNNYAHLLLSYSAMAYGESLEYFKQYIFKQYINADIFKTEYKNPRTGIVREDWRSTSELTTKEMVVTIDRLIAFAAKEMGLNLPSANQFDRIRQMQNEVERGIKFL